MIHVYRALFGWAVLAWLTVLGLAIHEAHALPWAISIVTATSVAYGIGLAAARARR